jgi:predicted nucleic acid-binding protein
MIIDTDVLIWYMRGNEKAYEIIENSPPFFISVLTYIELVQGMRNKSELNNLRKGKRLTNHIFTASQNYVKDFSKRFEEEFDDTMAGEQG